MTPEEAFAEDDVQNEGGGDEATHEPKVSYVDSLTNSIRFGFIEIQNTLFSRKHPFFFQVYSENSFEVDFK